MQLWSIDAMQILSSHIISLKFILLIPPQEEPVLYVQLLYLGIKLGSLCSYWSVIYRKNMPSGNAPMPFISDMIYFI